MRIKHKDHAYVVVVDKNVYDGLVSKRRWNFYTVGYAYDTEEKRGMHTLVWENLNGELVEPTIDHINGIKLDNRVANLRNVGMSEQNVNRGTRCDKLPIDDKLVKLGVTCLPRGMRYCDNEQKFMFNDHRFIRELCEVGRTVNSSGTKSSNATLADKLRDALEKYVVMFEVHFECFPSDAVNAKDLFLKQRELLASYNEIVATAKAAHPDLFQDVVMEMDDHQLPDDDYQLAQVLLHKIRPHTREVHGPRELASTDVFVDALDAVVRRKGDYKPVLYDVKHAAALKHVNWDAEDLRIHLSPSVKNMFPAIGKTFGNDIKKISLPEFVYHILDGNPVMEDHCIITKNQTRQDVRADNLMYVPGSSKNFKPPASLQPPFPIEDMPYLPRGVSMSLDTPYADGSLAYIFVVNTGSSKMRVRTKCTDARKVFAAKVVPLLGGIDQFQAKYKEYVKLVNEYMSVSV